MSFPWSYALASSVSPSLLNSMKAKEPYDRWGEQVGKEGRRIGAQEAARNSSRNRRKYLKVYFTCSMSLKFVC